MSDSRFHLVGKFNIYGMSFPFDWSLNWDSRDGEIDQRITEFFRTSHDVAYSAWCHQNKVHEANQLEARERLELERLEKKYR